MTKKQVERYVWLCRALANHGIEQAEVNALLRAEKTLNHWAERECGDGSDWAIERDETTGKPYNVYHGNGKPRRHSIPDREAGALKRVKAICDKHGLNFYHQTDPRGCAVYILRPGDVRPGSDVESCYSNGIGICLD